MSKEIHGNGRINFIKTILPELEKATETLIASNNLILKCLETIKTHQNDFTDEQGLKLFHLVVRAYNSTRLSQFHSHNVIMDFLRISENGDWTCKL